MKVIRIDPDWLRGYASDIEKAGDEFTAARQDLDDGWLDPEAFGDLGRTLRTADSYGRAAEMLYQQLQRASEVLSGAATGLRGVADHNQGQEQDAVHLIRRADHR